MCGSVQNLTKKKVNVFIEIEDVMKKFIEIMLAFIIIAAPLVILAQATTKVYQVDDSKCVGCTICVRKTQCPTKAITMKNGKAIIDTSRCISCGICAIQCPFSAISAVEIADSSKTEESQEGDTGTGLKEQQIFVVDNDACIGCTICERKCPVGAITMKDGKAVIDHEKCIQCGICEQVCPVNAIKKSDKTK